MLPTPGCSFCLLPETLIRVVSGCKTYLEQGRYTWRHDSILNFLAITFQSARESTIYVDLPGFLTPSAIPKTYKVLRLTKAVGAPLLRSKVY